MTAAGPASAATVLPPGFEDERVADIESATALAFTPEGGLLVTTLPGQVRYITPAGDLLEQPALDLRHKVCDGHERGLVGITADPGFNVNRAFYVFYTFNKHNGCPTRSTFQPVNRVSRFTLAADGRADPASEFVVLDNIPSVEGIHNAGDLHFGKDGNLYVSVGDSGCDVSLLALCGANNPNARNRHHLAGKIVRVTRDGQVPPDNPYTGSGTARCAFGSTRSGTICQEIYAFGLRNPFRMAFDPNAEGTRFFINDVGQTTWEEIDEGRAGADYGWNLREGPCATGSTTDCESRAGTTDPIHAYPHSIGCSSITGGAFVPAAGAFPAPYATSYLFADFVCATIFRLVPKAGGGYEAQTFARGIPQPGPVHMTFGPVAGGGQALYYTTFAEGGVVRRIRFTDSTNHRPVAALSASPVAGRTPLSVTFDAGRSSDPDGDPLVYLLDPGDGSPVIESSNPSVTRIYEREGIFSATLRVRDPAGLESAPARVTIHAGNQAPAVDVNVPVERFRSRERYTLRIAATDPDDGPLGGDSIVTTIVRHHATHVHPYKAPTAGEAVEFTGPDPEDVGAVHNTYLEIIVKATDSEGLSTTVTRTLPPRVVYLGFESTPIGVSNYYVNGNWHKAPFVFASWAGLPLEVSVPARQGLLRFHRWNDWVLSPRRTIVTPDATATYRAHYGL